MQVIRWVPLAVVLATLSACDDGGGTSRSRRAPPPDDPVAPVADSGRRIDDRHAALAPVRDGNLVVTPIVLSSAPAARASHLTLDDGLRAGLVTVRESGMGYQMLTVENRADRTLFVLSGEVVLEGHQDRTFQDSFTLAPGEQRTVPVWCVEQGRASGPGETFASAQAIVHPALRREVLAGDQSTVWTAVRDYLARHGMTSGSLTYRPATAAQQTGELGARRDRILAALGAVEGRDRLVGLALSLDAELVAVDLFADQAIYRELEAKLVGSYLAQAIDAGLEVRSATPAEIAAGLADPLERTDQVTTSITPPSPPDPTAGP